MCDITAVKYAKNVLFCRVFSYKFIFLHKKQKFI